MATSGNVALTVDGMRLSALRLPSAYREDGERSLHFDKLGRECAARTMVVVNIRDGDGVVSHLRLHRVHLNLRL